jgi:hypothetical protein
MIASQHVTEILSRRESTDIRRRDGPLPVWDLGRPGFFARHRRQRREAVAACRRELLNALLGCHGPIFLMHETPQGYEVPGAWRPVGGATWLVPRDFNLDHPAVGYWLFALGNWRLYRAPALAEGNWPDAFRCAAGELLAWLKAKSVWTLIESFHDDTDWVVALDTAEPNAEAGGRLVGSA